MRLYELLNEHEFPEIKTHQRSPGKIPDLYDYDGEDSYVDDDDEPPENNPHKQNPDIEVLGTGAFASAYRHKDNPQDITKGSKATKVPDGWQALFTALSKDKEAQANPYFPRFRSINKFKGKGEMYGDDRESYVAKVEALEPYSNLSKEEREMLMSKIFNEHGIDVAKHYIEEPRAFNKPGWFLAAAVRACLEGDTWEDELRWQIEDEKFKEAIEFLQKVADEENYEFDLHSNNLMVRRTSVGPQLVLNDPLGFSSSKDDDDEEGWE